MIFKFSKIYGIILITFFINSCGLLKESNNIVDYKTKRIPGFVDAPPYEERVLLHIIEEELYEAGYQNIMTDDTSLEYQYYIAAEI